MINVLKKVLVILVALLLIIVLAAVYLSSGNLAEDELEEVVEYQELQQIVDSTLTVATYNIGYLSGMLNNQSIKREKVFFDQNLQEAKKLIQELAIDIIGFQEIDFGSSRSFHVNQLDALAFAGGYLSCYKSINWDKKYVPFPYWPPSNHFGEMLSGQAILSKYPVNHGQTIKLTPHLSAPGYYRAFYLDRLLQIAEIEYLNQKIKVMNVHLEAFDTETRLEQIKIVKAVYEKYAAQQPVILLGDFNSQIPTKSEEMDAIDQLMNAQWISSAIRFTSEPQQRTFPSEAPEAMIDYIFFNENYLKCTNSRVLKEAGKISDHLPVWAELALK